MKTYVKPDLYYENFQLSTHVAACYYDMTNQSKPESCHATVDMLGDDFFVFIAEDACGFTAVEDYCYTNGSDDMNIFNS